MDRFLEQECDAVDASVSTGDALHNVDTRVEFKAFCERWLRAIAAAEQFAKDEECVRG